MHSTFINTRKNITEQLLPLENLSPQKYGQAAFLSLNYTPSKLSENLLFKEVNTHKKLQQEASKLRQTSALNSIFQDRLTELQQEKQGIQKTLNEQIIMYRRMLREKEQKNQKRIKLIQQSFNIEIKVLLQKRQEQVKFSQSEKEILEARIGQIQLVETELREKLDRSNRNMIQLKNENDRFRVSLEDMNRQRIQYQKLLKKKQQDWIIQIQKLKKQFNDQGVEQKRKLERELHQTKRELESIQKLFKIELEKKQAKKAQETLLKNQQIIQLAKTFENQSARLNAVIAKKEDYIIILNRTAEEEKDKTLAVFKVYQNDITTLTHEKIRLKEDLLKLERKLQVLTSQHADLQQKYNATSADSQIQISKIQKDLEFKQIHYIRQIQRVKLSFDQSTKLISKIKAENQQLQCLQHQNSILSKEVLNIRQLLIQSSLQIDKCKQQFIRICKEKDILAIRLQQINLENQALYILKKNRQQDVKVWRQNHYIQKSKY